MNKITQIIFDNLPLPKRQNPSGWYSFNCPVCIHKGHRPDTRSRGGFIFSSDGGFSYNCFNCNFKTKWEPGNYFNSSNLQLANYLSVSDDDIKILKIESLRETEEELNQSVENFKKYDLPKGSININELIDNGETNKYFIKCIEYLYNRNPNLFDWYTYYWCNSTDYDLRNRIIVPVYNHGKIMGWNARIVNKNKPKYIANVNKNILFNVDVIYNNPMRKYILVTEGIFDAISIDCVASMKSIMSEHQIKILDSSKAYKIIVPDKDKSGKELVDQALENEYFVSFPEWKFKDVAEAVEQYGRLPVLKHILNNITKSPLKISLKSKYYFK